MDERASDSDKTMQKGDSEVYSDDLHGGENRVTALETIMPGDTTANRPGEERRNRKKRPPPLNLRLLPPPSLPAVQMPFGHPYPGSSPRRYAFSSHARYQNGEEVVQDESLDNGKFQEIPFPSLSR
jgi:hypothetical protein